MPDDFKESFYAHSWGETRVGERETWPLQLTMTVEVMLDTAQPMFILWGAEKTLLFNEPYGQILGNLAPEALGTPLPELWAAIWQSVEPFVDSVYHGIGGLAENVPLLTWASGFRETRFYTFSYTPLRAPGGDVAGAIILCTDTTENVERSRQVQKERDTFLRLFEETPGFIAMVDGPDHRFTFANAAYRKLVGREDLVGRTVEEALPEIVEQGFPALLDQVLLTGNRFTATRMPIELELGEASVRQLRYVNFVYEPMRNEEGTVIGIFVEGHDVTDEVRAAEQVLSLQAELIHLSRVSAMGAMASTLAHELNQPLTAIQNYATGSERMVARGVKSSELSEPLAEIGKNAARAGEVIRRLREMTRKGEITKEPFIPDNVIKEAGALASVGACAGFNLQYDFRDALPVMGDPIQIQQVLINLIRNACEAVASCGEPNVRVVCQMAGDDTLISIEDNGPGISADVLPILFDAFFSTKDDGMGVGLSISRTIIEAHGGTIWAENRPEGGARFSFTLPLAL